MARIQNSVKMKTVMKSTIEKTIKGNKEKYLSYKLAFRMINDAIKCKCYLQAITIEESIMSDRFLSCICHINGSKYNFNASVNKALNDLLNLNQGWDNEIKIDGCSLFDKIDLLNKFWNSRCSLLHGIAKSPSGKGPEIFAENFIKQAKETAIVGKVLTRWVCDWSKRQLKANQKQL